MAGPRASDAHPRAGDCTGGRMLCAALTYALELARAVAKAVAGWRVATAGARCVNWGHFCLSGCLSFPQRGVSRLPPPKSEEGCGFTWETRWAGEVPGKRTAVPADTQVAALRSSGSGSGLRHAGGLHPKAGEAKEKEGKCCGSRVQRTGGTTGG